MLGRAGGGYGVGRKWGIVSDGCDEGEWGIVLGSGVWFSADVVRGNGYGVEGK